MESSTSYKLTMAGLFCLGMSAFFWLRGLVTSNKQLVYRLAVFALGAGLMTAGGIAKLMEDHKGK